MSKLLEILKNSNVEIPELYLEYLTGDNFNSEIQIFKGQDEYRLYTLEELCETITIDKNQCLRVTELEGYVKSLMEVFDGEDSIDEFSFEELSECLSIGYENEAVLFIDSRDKKTLWVFHPDGGDIEPTKITLAKVINHK